MVTQFLHHSKISFFADPFIVNQCPDTHPQQKIWGDGLILKRHYFQKGLLKVTGKELINQVLYNDKRASEMEKGPKRNELCYESTNLRKD